ncbi:MAG: (2Fe-2S) ferredoxin domain-containing protein [Ignavibacteriaceae bacterium]|nr:(2Fe-2S) ferredoxin domain-containing protein [Ignavibacteriaceae bacterium]
MKRFEKHIFICENVRPDDNPRGSCGQKGGSLVKEAFKQKIKTLGLNAEVRANTCGCLDACEFGITVVVYPEQVWYGGVKIEDVDEIINSHIINNKPVERLFIKDKRYTKDLNES